MKYSSKFNFIFNTSTWYWWDHCSRIYVSLKLWLSFTNPQNSMPVKYWWNHSDSFVQTYHFSQPGTATGHTKECPPLSYWKILTLDFWKSEKFIQVFRYWKAKKLKFSFSGTAASWQMLLHLLISLLYWKGE